MPIEKELKNLVQYYARFDEEKNGYISQLDTAALLSLDRDFANLMTQELLAAGSDKNSIKKNFKKISLQMHTDRRNHFSPEILWIEHQLSQGINDGACFKSLVCSYEKLTSPQKFNANLFKDVRNSEDLRHWLERLKNQASTFGRQSFYGSLLSLLNQSNGFFDEAGRIKPSAMRVLIKSIPVLFATYGSFIFAEELFILYTLYFVLLKGGQYISRSDSNRLKQIGATLQEIGIMTATATTIVLVRLIEMTFWVSRNCLEVSLNIGSKLLAPFLAAPSVMVDEKEESEDSLCKDLILANQNLSEGKRFKTPELKCISAPLESYLALNAQQFLGNWRAGRDKRYAIEDFLFQLSVLDERADSIEVKLTEAQKRLALIKSNANVYSNKTAQAIEQAEQVISLFKEPNSNNQLSVIL